MKKPPHEDGDGLCNGHRKERAGKVPALVMIMFTNYCAPEFPFDAFVPNFRASFLPVIPVIVCVPSAAFCVTTELGSDPFASSETVAGAVATVLPFNLNSAFTAGPVPVHSTLYCPGASTAPATVAAWEICVLIECLLELSFASKLRGRRRLKTAVVTNNRENFISVCSPFSDVYIRRIVFTI